MIVLNRKNKETGFFNLLQKSTKDPLLVPQESRNVDVHPEGSVMDIHRVNRQHMYNGLKKKEKKSIISILMIIVQEQFSWFKT